MSYEDAIKAAIGDAISDGAINGIDAPHPALAHLNAEFSRLRSAFQQPSQPAVGKAQKLLLALWRWLSREF